MISTRGKVFLYCAAFACILFAFNNTNAGGLSTQLGEVVIENLQIGQHYNLKQLANLRLPVTNTSEIGVRLKLDIIVPEESELRHEADPIPNKSWIELSDSLFDMNAGETIMSDIFIRIPDDDQHLGKIYQVMIWSHTVPGDEAGMFLACGLKSRIIFTVDSVRAKTEILTESSAMAPSFLLEPSEVALKNLTMGEKHKIGTNAETQLKITNTSDTTYTFKIVSQANNSTAPSSNSGYLDAPNTSYLSFGEDEITLEPGQTKEIETYLLFPNNPEFSGNKYIFIVHVFCISEKITSGKYCRVFVTMR